MVIGMGITLFGMVEMLLLPNVKADVPDGLFQIMLGALLMLAGMLNLFILLPERAAKAFNLKEFGLR